MDSLVRVRTTNEARPVELGLRQRFVEGSRELALLGIKITTLGRSQRITGRLNRQITHPLKNRSGFVHCAFSDLGHRNCIISVANRLVQTADARLKIFTDCEASKSIINRRVDALADDNRSKDVSSAEFEFMNDRCAAMEATLVVIERGMLRS